MMQAGCRCIFRHLKCLNHSAYSTFFHTLAIKQKLLGNGLHLGYKNNNFTKYCTSTSLSLPKKKSVKNIEDLKSYIDEERQFYLKLLTNILDNIEFDNISSEDASLLLVCCGRAVADSSKQSRDNVCQDIYNKLLSCNKMDLDICHTFIETCTDNHVVIKCKEFLAQLKFEPNQKTYTLLFDNVSERGDIVQALELLEIMKAKQISANEEIFNKLVLAYTIREGVKSGETVLRTMRMAQIPETSSTKFSILKGVLQGDHRNDLDYVLQKYPVDLTEEQLLEFLELLGLCGNIAWLTHIKHLYSNINFTRDYTNSLRRVCIHLVHMDKCESAIEIYEEFVEPEKDQNYGFFILKEMLHCNVEIERITRLCKHLRDSNLNEYAFEKLTELALRYNYTEASWKLLENMFTLRPHFFWPLLLNANKNQGEIGVFNVVQKMVDMGVKIDPETLQSYIFPFCSTDDIKLLVKKLQNLKITIKEAVSPLIMMLLRNNEVKQAVDVCTTYDVSISGENLFKLISSSWTQSKDNDSTVLLLQKYCESNLTENDFVGDFLTETLDSCSENEHFVRYVELLKLIHTKKLRINTVSVDNLCKLVSEKCQNGEIAENVTDEVNKLLDFDLTQEIVHIPHPRNMSLDELECHLIELQEKSMETRGVLRRLIQKHSSLGHLDRVEELREVFSSAGYEESVGMKSMLMHDYTKKGYLEQALNVYNEIKCNYSSFKIDDFKIIDLATLMVKQEKLIEAMDLLKAEVDSTRIIGGSALVRNCWQLLGSYTNAEEQLKMFKFLIESRYCEPNNIIFGPLVRIHLNKGDLGKSVKVYVNCAKEYRCTPLQLEIIKEVLKAHDERLLKAVLDTTRKVHGSVPTQCVLITALAENGQEKVLQKLFLKNKLNVKNELQKRCGRWVHEGKVGALRTLAGACHRLPKEIFDVNFVYNCIMKVYSINNDYKSALEFHEQLLKNEVILDSQLEMLFQKLKTYNSNKSKSNVVT